MLATAFWYVEYPSVYGTTSVGFLQSNNANLPTSVVDEKRSERRIRRRRQQYTELINELEEHMFKLNEENDKLLGIAFGPAYGESYSHHSRHCLT